MTAGNNLEKVLEENLEPLQLDSQPDQGRITVTMGVHFQKGPDEPQSTSGAFHFYTESDQEEVYRRRRLKAEQGHSIPLETGWIPIDEVGIVVIENLAGKNLKVNPTEEEQKEFAKQVIDVMFNESSGIEIKPGQQFPFVPTDPSNVTICCRHGIVRYNLAVYPR